MTEKNWREFPAGRDLDRIVAERLGWHVEKVRAWWQLYTPDGAAPSNGLSYVGADECWSAVPAYSTSVEAALGLPCPTGAFHLVYDEVQDSSSAIIEASGLGAGFHENDTYGSGRAAELPALMVYAWLTMMDQLEAVDD